MIDKTKIHALKSLFDVEKQLDEEIKEKLKEFEKENKTLYEGKRKAIEQIEELKEEIRIQAIDEYRETENKKLYGGIGIRIYKKLDYEKEIAMKWAETNMPVAIIKELDKKQFESYAKENTPDFVEVIESEIVTFPKEIKTE
ncbi:MAG: hypothetical protein ACOC3Z_00570 [Nanoarchaeota archaeon]